jgi:hypothetical protein
VDNAHNAVLRVLIVRAIDPVADKRDGGEHAEDCYLKPLEGGVLEEEENHY